MSEFNLTKLPSGELGRRALLEYVMSSDDRVERYFLEVKSDVDLNSKAGRAKVAKFILGAANRDPIRSAKRFDGCAILVIGVGGGEATGVGKFEAHELASAVTKFIGADGPTWDFERITIDADHDVIMVIVDPPDPDAQPWTCRSDGSEGLFDGVMYVRGDGDTRRATGDEVREMVRRRSTAQLPIEVDVQIDGSVFGCAVDEGPFIDEINAAADDLLPPIVTAPGVPRTLAASLLSSRSVMDSRSREAFEAEVEEWRAAALADPLAGMRQVVAHAREGLRIRAINRTMTYLSDVRIDLEFTGPVRAVEWEAPLEKGNKVDWMPGGRPRTWGTQKRYDFLGVDSLVMPSSPSLAPRRTHGITAIKEELPATLILRLDELRPDETQVSDDDDVVLMLWPIGTELESVTARWKLTAAGVNGVFTGEVEVPVMRTELNSAALFKRDPVEEE